MGISYLDDVEVHQFAESMTITECAVETLAMASHEWDAIDEAVDIDGVSLFEAEILGLAEADEKKDGGFLDKLKELGSKIIAMLKKIASYIMGVISKWLIALKQLNQKDASKAKDRARCLRGANKFAANKGIKLYGLLMVHSPSFQSFQNDIEKDSKELDYSRIQAMTKEDIATIEANLEIYGDKLRGSISAAGQPVPAKNFKAALLKQLTTYEGTFEYEFTGNKVEQALKNALRVIESKANIHKKYCNDCYKKIKGIIDNMINSIKESTVKAKSIDDKETRNVTLAAIKVLGKKYNIASSILSSTNSIVLNTLAADYRTNAQIVLKCWMAGGSEKKAESSSTNESVESIFGLDLI